MNYREKKSSPPIFTRTLPDYNLSIPTMIVGETGSGKSTLLDLVLQDRKMKKLPTLLFSLRVSGQKEAVGAPTNVILSSQFKIFDSLFILLISRRRNKAQH